METIQKRLNNLQILYSAFAFLIFFVYLSFSLINTANYVAIILALILVLGTVYVNYQNNRVHLSKLASAYDIDYIKHFFHSNGYTINYKDGIMVAKPKSIIKRILSFNSKTIYIHPFSKEIVARNAEIKMIKNKLQKTANFTV